jgi:hypothetical protein
MCFQNSNVFFAGINNKQSGRQFFHVFDAAQVFVQFFHLMTQAQNFFFRQHIKRPVFFHLFQLTQTGNSFLNRFEVGHHAAQPTLIHVELVAADRFFTHRFLCLFFRADKQNITAILCRFTDEIVGFIYLFNGFLQVDDVDAVAFGEDVLRHFGIPAAGLMTEVHAGFQQLFHRNNTHFYIASCFFLRSRSGIWGTPGSGQSPDDCVCIKHLKNYNTVLRIGQDFFHLPENFFLLYGNYFYIGKLLLQFTIFIG